MNHVLYVAWRYLRHHWVKTTVLVASITLILFLPAGLYVVVEEGASSLTARAESTPLLVGAKGSAVDLCLAALYFREPRLDAVEFREATRVSETGLATGIPLHLRFAAGGHRIVGTSIDYLEFRGLAPDRGRVFSMLGECLLGARAAKALDVDVGGHVLSSSGSAFDVAGSFPLKMRVVGVLSPAGTPDDDAVFADVKTAWVIAGLAHGHEDVTDASEDDPAVLRRSESEVVASPSVLPHTEITEENRASFHFHGDRGGFPIDAVLAVPTDRKSGIKLRGRHEEDPGDVQMLVPSRVVGEVLDTMFRVRDYVVLGGIAVAVATLATCVLVFVLSIAARRREIETIRKLGGSGRRVRAILAAEIMMTVLAAVVITGVLTAITSGLSEELVRVIGG